MISEVSKLKGRKFHLVVLEPFEIATPIGESGLTATVHRFVAGEDDALLAEISLSPPLELGGITYPRLLAAPRHVGKEWASLLADRSLTVQLGTEAEPRSVHAGVDRARLGKLVAVGHLRIP